MAPRKRNDDVPRTPSPPPMAASDNEEEVESQMLGSDDEHVETPSVRTSAAVPSPAAAGLKSATAAAGNASKRQKKKKKKPAAVAMEEEPQTEKTKKKKKKPLIQKLFNDDDEIAMVQCMLDYKAETGKVAMDDLVGYYNFVIGKLHAPFTHKQFEHKVKRLKQRYVKNALIGKPRFDLRHEHQLYNLSVQVWGSEVATLSVAAVNGKSTRAKFEQVDTSTEPLFLSEMVRNRDVIGEQFSADYVKRGWERLDDGKKNEVDKKWGAMLLEESKMRRKRARLVEEVVELTVNAII